MNTFDNIQIEDFNIYNIDYEGIMNQIALDERMENQETETSELCYRFSNQERKKEKAMKENTKRIENLIRAFGAESEEVRQFTEMVESGVSETIVKLAYASLLLLWVTTTLPRLNV